MTNQDVADNMFGSTIFDYKYGDNNTVYLMLEKDGAKSILMIAYVPATKWQHVSLVPWQYYNEFFPDDPRPVNEYGVVQ